MVNREEKYKDAGILVQIVITVALIMFVLLYLISNISSFATIVGMLVGLLLLAMAFNNHVSFKRKYFTWNIFNYSLFNSSYYRFYIEVVLTA